MDNKGILVVALSQRGQLLPATFELLACARSIAQATNEPISAVAVGAKAGSFAQELVDRGAAKVFVIDSPALDTFNDELATKAVAELAEKEKFAKILLPAAVAGRSLAARLTVKLKAGLAPEITEVHQNGTGLKAQRAQFSGNVIADLEFKAPVQVLTVQGMAFPQAEKKAGSAGEIVKVPFEAGASRVEYVSFQAEESNEIDLGAAEKIVSGGRGLGSAEGFKPVRDLAHAIGAAVGASRAVVDSGWIPYRHQVGLTGRAVRPKLYIAVGISGQIQHLAGMSSSGTIVAINTDAACPMMEIASIGVVGDYAQILPAMIEEIKKRKGGAVAA
jgi:electron transfer flavoprotein alpha subunit